MRSYIKKLRDRYWQYERYWSAGALLLGFVWDNLTLRRIDLWLDNLILFTYLSIAGISILILSMYEAGRLRTRLMERYAEWLLLIIQFAFGGLFSGYIVFYSRSGSIVFSWPFILVLAILLIGNEMFRKRYEKLAFRISIFYIALFSFSIFYLPIVMQQIGVSIFLLSGMVSLAAMGLYVFVLFMMMPRRIMETKFMLAKCVGGIYLSFNILYFANVIPPLPLALKDIGVYHSLERIGSGYVVSTEQKPWYLIFNKWGNFHAAPGETAYLYSAVFAPTRLETRILHRWALYDSKKGEWVTKNVEDFPIVGGRDGGYRGYSFKTNITPGYWRVDVITERGQLLGRAKFKVVSVETQPELVEGIK